MISNSTLSPGRLIHTVLALLLLASRALADTNSPAASAGPRRIISLAPSITEMVFALGFQDRLVGVTRYCDFPPAASKITKVGGYIDPSYEEIVALKPELTILLASHRDAKTQIEKIGLRTLTTPHQTLEDIQEAIRLIADACGNPSAATTLLADLVKRTKSVQETVAGKHRPRVLVCIGRDIGAGQLTGMYVAGCNGFFNQVIELAGGVNAYTNKTVALPQLSAEGVLQLGPEVVVDLLGEMVSKKAAPGEAERQWAKLGTVPAVRDSRVHVLVGNWTLRPGPRYIQFMEDLARLLHPEAFPSLDSNDTKRPRR